MEETVNVIEVPANTAGSGPAFPAFDTTTYPSQLIWLALTFGLLYILMSRISLPRVQSILDARHKRISSDMAEAIRLKDEANAAQHAYEKALAEARGNAQTLAASTRDKLNAEADASRKVLEAELASKLHAAEEKIQATKAAALSNVHTIAVDAAGAIVEKIAGKAPTPGDVEKAVDDAIKAA